jgi:hypothetical protein
MQSSAVATTPSHAEHAVAEKPEARLAPAPVSSPQISNTQPGATLKADAFDAPAPASVAEAMKASQGGGHAGHETRGITPGTDHENPPTPMPATRDKGNANQPATDHSQHAAPRSPSAAPGSVVVYTCPMHPEVTSNQPGTCPKCGMALVKKQ